MPKKFTWAQIEDIHRARAARIPRAQLASEYGVSEEAIRYWKDYAGLPAKWIKRVKALETRNNRLTKQYAALEQRARIAATVITQFVPSARKRSVMSPALQACYGLDRTTANRILGLSAQCGIPKVTQRDDANLIQLMREYINANPGHGFNMMFKVLLQHQPGTRFHAMQVYIDQKLMLKDRTKRIPIPRRVFRPMAIQGKPDTIWSMDFLVDALPTGKRFWVLNIIDDFNRESLAIKVVTNHTAKSVVETLEEVALTGRLPKCIRTDNGGEFRTDVYQGWAKRNKVKCLRTRPYRCCDNAFVERFNRTLRGEVLSRYSFHDLDEVQRMVDDCESATTSRDRIRH